MDMGGTVDCSGGIRAKVRRNLMLEESWDMADTPEGKKKANGPVVGCKKEKEWGRGFELHVQVVVTRAFSGGNPLLNHCYHLPQFSQTTNFRVFIQVLFFIAETLR